MLQLPLGGSQPHTPCSRNCSHQCSSRLVLDTTSAAAVPVCVRHPHTTRTTRATHTQVHTATTHDGRKVAVKVQHAGLRESCAADITTIEFLVSAARAVFPDFNYQWLVDEIKHNLPLELNFTHEAQNAARCRDNLNSTRSTVAKR